MSQSQALMDEANQIALQAQTALEERSVQALKDAIEVLKAVKRMRLEVNEAYDEIIAVAKASYDTARERKKVYDDPLDEAERTIKEKVIEYYEWEERRQAEEYRERVNDAVTSAEIQREAEIKFLTENGRPEEASYLSAQPLALVAVPKPQATAVKGVSVQERWFATVENIDMLWGYCNDNPTFRRIFKIDMPTLNKLATAQKELFGIPGCKAESKRVVAIRL